MSEPEALSAEISEEYEIWKKNCPIMYSELKECVLEWPSLTFQWVPHSQDKVALVGTITGETAEEGEPEYLAIIQPELGGTPENFTKSRSEPHNGEVNRARVSPLDASLIASIGPDGSVNVYSPTLETIKITLKGHHENGYGLAWNPQKLDLLLTGADDGKAILWDVSSGEQKWSNEFGSRVNDVTWSNSGQKFAVGTEDGHAFVYELDGNAVKKDSLKIKAHEKGINALAFNPFTENMLGTASDDQNVTIWDLRDTDSSIFVLSGHTASVTVLKWSPLHDGVLASAGPDRRVILWDLKKVGQEQQADDAEDAVPELIFMHGGHTAPVTDFDWHPSHPWLIGSVSEDNICQTWVPSKAAVGILEAPEMPRYLV